MYMNKSSVEDLVGPGETVPFLLNTILLELEGGRYVGPIFPAALADLVSERSWLVGVTG